MHENWLTAGLLGLMLILLGVEAGHGDRQGAGRCEPAACAQEPAGAEKTPAIDVNDLPRLFDAKTLEDPKAAAAAVAKLESAFKGQRPPEAVRMLLAILRREQLGAENGWFGPAETRFSWDWLAKCCGVDPLSGEIPRARFRGEGDWFALLDRNKDGKITPGDLDWSSRNPEVQMAYLASRLFRKMNAGGNGRLTREEMLKFFDTAAQGKEFLTQEEFSQALLAGMSSGFLPGDAPTQEMLVRGLYAGELGSMHEGPWLEQPAPDFTLKTVDGSETLQLTKLIGPKPVVLVLGNFTCGPFRTFFTDVESVYRRHKKEANFLMVYVREAHPSDGWKMASNTRVGVAVKQPTTLQERVAVAGQFCERLKPAMPVVVDDVNDRVGHAYSGMPARMYVIDCLGKIAYKSGRGPFGFRVGEMEQALVMALLEQAESKRK